MSNTERGMRHLPARLILASRWMMAPLYLGLIVSFLLILLRFFTKLFGLFWTAQTQSTNEVIVGVLSLVELSLMGNLIIMVVFSGYENYVSRIYAENDPERPSWMEHVDFSDIKLKLMGSIVAITAIQLLELFLDVTTHTDRELYFAIGIHMVFVFSCVMLALMDRLSAPHSSGEAPAPSP
ncbi:TIGR00645 family protein [Acidisoma cladoniae]|jgi:uncharacterized protein (TIGR00645 family)|uniref:TIGR00645 family protein n=1 Tax=Acidisoma cladoniae TaxID=3040935 RepID=UPI0025507446|nr:TIGR00645 family protein [Acidisoma sp. PAMC 29798]